MGMLGNFIAGAAGDAADYTKRSGLQAQMQEAEMLKAQRIAEMQQNYKIADEDRSRANDLKAGQDIESTAKGMIAANAPPKPGVAADGTLTVDGAGLDPNQKASRLENLQAQADAAKSKGYTKQASEINAEIQAEVGNKRADSQDKRYDQQNETNNKRADNLQEYNQRREDRLDRMAEAQQAFQQGRAGKDDARAQQADINAQRAATVAAMKGTQEDIKSLEFDKKNIPLTMDMAAAKTYSDKIDGQLATLRNEASRYRKTLAGAGLDAGEEPASGKVSAADFAPKPQPVIAAAPKPQPVAVTPQQKPDSPSLLRPAAEAAKADGTEYNFLYSDNEVAQGVAAGNASAIQESKRRQEGGKRKRGGGF